MHDIGSSRKQHFSPNTAWTDPWYCDIVLAENSSFDLKFNDSFSKIVQFQDLWQGFFFNDTSAFFFFFWQVFFFFFNNTSAIETYLSYKTFLNQRFIQVKLKVLDYETAKMRPNLHIKKSYHPNMVD